MTSTSIDVKPPIAPVAITEGLFKVSEVYLNDAKTVGRILTTDVQEFLVAARRKIYAFIKKKWPQDYEKWFGADLSHLQICNDSKDKNKDKYVLRLSHLELEQIYKYGIDESIEYGVDDFSLQFKIVDNIGHWMLKDKPKPLSTCSALIDRISKTAKPLFAKIPGAGMISNRLCRLFSASSQVNAEPKPGQNTASSLWHRTGHWMTSKLASIASTLSFQSNFKEIEEHKKGLLTYQLSVDDFAIAALGVDAVSNALQALWGEVDQSGDAQELDCVKYRLTRLVNRQHYNLRK